MAATVNSGIAAWILSAWILSAWATGASVAAPGTAAAGSTPHAPEFSEAGAEQSAQRSPKPISTGAILAGCMGVLFGGLVARWQIRALKRRDRT